VPFPETVKLTTHLRRVLRLTMSGALPPLPICNRGVHKENCSIIVISIIYACYLSTLSIAKVIYSVGDR
jgi:hypothetical protein